MRDLSPLAGLQGLRSLDLSETGVTDLAPMSGLPGTSAPHAAEHGRDGPSPPAGSQGLQEPRPVGHLREGPPRRWPGCKFWRLPRLWLPAGVPRAMLRANAELPRLTDLRTDEAAGVPREVLSHALSDNCLPRLRAYFSELDLGVEAESEVKVILLGNGRVGKTQLCRRLRGRAV